MLFDPAPGVALKTLKPQLGVAGFELDSLDVAERCASSLPIARFGHVLGQFTGFSCQREVQPARRQCKRQLVRIAKLRDGHPVLLRPVPRVSECEICPVATKEQTHDFRAQVDVAFTFLTVHIGAPKVADVVQPECRPKADVPRKTVQNPPSRRNEKRVDEKAVRSEKNALGSNSHSVTYGILLRGFEVARRLFFGKCASAVAVALALGIAFDMAAMP